MDKDGFNAIAGVISGVVAFYAGRWRHVCNKWLIYDLEGTFIRCVPSIFINKSFRIASGIFVGLLRIVFAISISSLIADHINLFIGALSFGALIAAHFFLTGFLGEQQFAEEFEKTMNKGKAVADFRKAGEGLPEAIAGIIEAAEQGNADFQSSLGLMYEEGNGVPQDLGKAVEWYRKAADQGHADAQFLLGDMYLNGRGVSRDAQIAAAWFRKSAEQGNADSQRNLGIMHGKGLGVSQDGREALCWLRKAAEQEDATAQYLIGLLHVKGEGVPQDFREAAVWTRKAAEQGHADAQCMLGDMYRKGEGVQSSFSDALFWYEKAVEQGQPNAQHNLVVMKDILEKTLKKYQTS